MGGQWSGGKGDQTRRVNKAEFDKNYERIFGSKKNDDARLGEAADVHDGGSKGRIRGKGASGSDLPVRSDAGGGVDAEGSGEICREELGEGDSD